MDFNVVFHIVCISMFVIGGLLSKGKLNIWAGVCTLGLLGLGAAYTGVLGSLLSLVQ